MYAGYQAIYGDSAFPSVFANITPLGNEVPTYEFAYTDERSWQPAMTMTLQRWALLVSQRRSVISRATMSLRVPVTKVENPNGTWTLAMHFEAEP